MCHNLLMRKNILKWEYLLMLLTLGSISSAMMWNERATALQKQLDQALIIEHTGRGEEIVIRRGEAVMGEWEPRDGEVYEVLDEALHES